MPSIRMAPPVDVVEAGQEVQEGGFAGAGGAHQGHHFAPAHGEVDVVEDVLPAVVGEAYPRIADLPSQGGQGRGPGGVFNLRLPVHEAEDPHRRGQAFLDDVLDGAQALDGLVEHEEGGQKGEKGPGGGGAPDDGIAAVKNNPGHSQGAQELHHRRGELPGGVQLHADAEVVPVGPGEAPLLVGFPGEGLDDALADEGLLEHGVEVGVGHLGRLGDAADAFAQMNDDEDRQREDHHGHEGQAPLPVKNHRGEADDGEGIFEEAGHHPGHRVLEEIDVVSEAAHEHPGGLAVKKGQGLALQRGEELIPQAGDGGVADVAHLVVVGVGQKPLDEIEDHHQGRQEVEHVLPLGEKDVVQDGLHHVGQQRRERRDPQHGEDGRRHAPLVGFEIGEQAEV